VKTVAIVDTETSGLDPKTGELLEVAVALWSFDLGLVQAGSIPVRAEANAAHAVNGIPLALVRDFGRSRDGLDVWLAGMTAGADAIVAHNADFDRQWLPELHGRPWICTCNDVTWPEPVQSRSLTAIALAHGVGVVDAHRALTDVLTIVRLFGAVQARGHSVHDLLEAGLRPKATYRALVSYDDREKAKQAGFRWDAGRKVWVRKMAVEDASKLPFKVQQMESA
jgi:DNA polymerase-3 subunit epsilon